MTVTLDRAAELSGRSLNDFIELLRLFHIPWGEYTEEKYHEDQIAVEELLGEQDEKE